MSTWVDVEVSYDDGETWHHESLKSTSVIVQELRLYTVASFKGVHYRWEHQS